MEDAFRSVRRNCSHDGISLFGIAPHLLAAPLAGQSLLHPALFSRLQIVGVFLNFFDDVFLLDLAFETAQSVFQRLAFLESYFRQSSHPLAV